mgnify:FL=1
MNIFVLDTDPIEAARMYCDKHVPKMVVELLQQLGSAAIRHGATPDMMPLTKKGTPLKGGYHHHPCTVWCGESNANYAWAFIHAIELCKQYRMRFNKTHFCEAGIRQLFDLMVLLPIGKLTPFALAMPDEHRPGGTASHAEGEDATNAYRSYYHTKEFAKWEKGIPAPDWWQGIEVIA